MQRRAACEWVCVLPPANDRGVVLTVLIEWFHWSRQNMLKIVRCRWDGALWQRLLPLQIHTAAGDRKRDSSGTLSENGPRNGIQFLVALVTFCTFIRSELYPQPWNIQILCSCILYIHFFSLVRNICMYIYIKQISQRSNILYSPTVFAIMPPRRNCYSSDGPLPIKWAWNGRLAAKAKHFKCKWGICNFSPWSHHATAAKCCCCRRW